MDQLYKRCFKGNMDWSIIPNYGEFFLYVTSGQEGQLTIAHNSVKTESLNWEQIGGCQWRNDLAESRVKASKVTRWCTLFRMLRGDDPTQSHVELCATLAAVANVAGGQPIPLRSRTRRTSGAPLEPQAVQDNQYLGPNRHQQDRVNLWWKPWSEQRFISRLAKDHLDETKRHTSRKAEPCTANQDLHKRPGEEDQEIKIDVQQLVPRGLTDEEEPSAKERKKWSGHVNYTIHHGVDKSKSSTTVQRVVSNSPWGNSNLVVSYNSILAKGPNSLMPLVAALVRWRSYKRALAWDLSKTHNAYTLPRILANYDFRPPGCPRTPMSRTKMPLTCRREQACDSGRRPRRTRTPSVTLSDRSQLLLY